MIESKFGHRDSKGNYKPNKRVGYPPVFVWPVQPLALVKWLVAIPGYFLPWNTLYVTIGLITWFFLSPPLSSYSHPSIELALLLFVRNSFDQIPKEFLESVSLAEGARKEQEVAESQQQVLNKAPLKIYIG